jgi:hypothetical protein
MTLPAARPRFSALARCAVAFGLLALAPLPASAAPLDKGACAKLATDMQNLKALDVDRLMENGPAWAAAHLSPSDLSLIRQYIDLDEQLKFRCSAPSSLVHLKHLDEEDEGGGQAAADGAAEAKKAQNGGEDEDAPAPKKRPRAARVPRN